MEQIIVYLTDAEMDECARIGVEVHAEAWRNGAVHKNNLELDFHRDRRRHIQAAQSEFATKKHIGPWCVWNNRRGEPDLESFIEVKTVTDPRYRLIVPVDQMHPEWAYVSVRKYRNKFHLRGWRWGSDLINIREFQPGRPAHYCETAALEPMDKLVALAKERHVDAA